MKTSQIIEERLMQALCAFRYGETPWEEIGTDHREAIQATVREFMVCMQVLRTVESDIKNQHTSKPVIVEEACPAQSR